MKPTQPKHRQANPHSTARQPSQRKLFARLGICLLAAYSAFAFADDPGDSHAIGDSAEGWNKQRAKEESDEHGNVDPLGVHKALLQRQALLNAQAGHPHMSSKLAGIGSPTAWSALGPGNIGGRVRSMVMVPGSNKLLVGSASGGIWASSDRGQTWQVINDWMGSLSIGSLTVDPNNSNVIYAGTGEGPQNIYGDGIFKSTDGGATWNQLPSTMPAVSGTNSAFFFVNRIAVKRGNANIIVAGTKQGLFSSVDGGSTWTTYKTDTVFQDVKFDPNNNSNLVAGGLNGDIYTSTDSGATWTQHSVASSGRMEIAFAASSNGTVYASGDQNSGTVYKSTDGGNTWKTLANPKHLGDQGDYDNAIWVDPTNAQRILIAGLDSYRSLDGGATWTKVSDWTQSPQSSHADHHVLIADTAFDGSGNLTVYDGDDGGVYVTSNFLTVTSAANGGWTSLNNGLPITQFYSVATNRNGLVIGGAQDNGSLQYQGNANTWVSFYGGDGGASAVDQTNSNNFYGEYVYLQIFNTLDGGQDTNDIYSGIADAGGNGNNALFIAPFMLDPNNAQRMYAGGQSLWRSDSVATVMPTWSAVAKANAQGDLISAIAVSPNDPNVVWYGTENGALYYSTNALSATPTWQATKTAVPARYINGITVDADSGRVYVVTGGFTDGNLQYTVDSGATWTAVGSANGLPQAPFRSIVRHPANPNWLYLGTYVGIFTSEDGGKTWSTNTTGPANVQIKKLVWQDSNHLVAATYGRGAYVATVGTGSAQFSSNSPGTSSKQTIDPIVDPAPADIGKSGAIFVAAVLPNGQLYMYSNNGWFLYDPNKPVAYSIGNLQHASIPAVTNLDLTSIGGTVVAVGYGLGNTANQAFSEMLTASRYSVVFHVH